jgi:Tfp pilus assembly protein PilV
MEAFVPALLLAIAVAGLVAFDLLALRFGADSRPTIGDDHARSVHA